MRKRLWDLAKSRIEIGTILPGHRHKVIAATNRCYVLRLYIEIEDADQPETPRELWRLASAARGL